MDAGSRLHPVRFRMSSISKERLGTCSSATSWLGSNPNPFEKAPHIVEEVLILAAKSTTMEITLVAEIGFVAKLL